MDDLAVASAGQIEATREHIARVGPTVSRVALAVWPTRVVPVAVIGAFAYLMALIVAIAPVVMLLDARRTRAASR